jgi:hypothetical protein
VAEQVFEHDFFAVVREKHHLLALLRRAIGLDALQNR